MTQFHHASYLLERAGNSFEHAAKYGHTGRNVYIKNGPLTQNDLDIYQCFVRAKTAEAWLQRDIQQPSKLAWGPAPLSMNTPNIKISNGMQTPGKDVARIRVEEQVDDTGPKAEDLAYVLIVQGAPGASICKLMIAQDLSTAASAILKEALNGYSTVFSGAVLKTDLPRLQDEGHALKVVQKRGALTTTEADFAAKTIEIWC